MSEQQLLTPSGLASVKQLQTMHPLNWILMLGFFFSRAAFYMVWPFVGIILNRRFGLDSGIIGLILGAGLFVSSFTSFFAGNLSDRIGRRPVMLCAVFLYAVVFAGLAVVDQLLPFLCLSVLIGVINSAFESPAKALSVDLEGDKSKRELVLNFRYFCINLGAITGPAVGLLLGLSAQTETFLITALVYFIFWIILLIGFYLYPESKNFKINRNNNIQVRAAIKVIHSDRSFVLFIVGFLFYFAAYSQYQSVLPLYLTSADPENGIWLYSMLIIINGITIVLIQFPLVAYFQSGQMIHAIRIGTVLTALGFIGFAMFPPQVLYFWFASMVVFSVGEVIIFPLLEIHVDRVAKPELKGSYLGASYLSRIGMALGPLLGGIVLQFFGGPVLLLMSALLVGISMIILNKSLKPVQK